MSGDESGDVLAAIDSIVSVPMTGDEAAKAQADYVPEHALGADLPQSPTKWEPTVLLEAINKTTGDRNRQYGDPMDNHGCTAGLWTLYLARRFPSFREQLFPEDVCALNVLQKTSRLANDPSHLDSWVDVAGFAGNAGTCIEADIAKDGQWFRQYQEEQSREPKQALQPGD